MADLDPAVEQLLSLAVDEAHQAGSSAVEPIHLFIALCKDDSTVHAVAVREEGHDPTNLRRRARGVAHAKGGETSEGPRRVSTRVRRILDLARDYAKNTSRKIQLSDVFKALLERPDGMLVDFFVSEGVVIGRVLERLHGRRPISAKHPHEIASMPAARASGAGLELVARPIQSVRKAHPDTPTLDQVGRDLTASAIAGNLGPVIGRKPELKQVIRTLLRTTKCNPVLVGDPGVGKTAIVEALAQEVVTADASTEIRDWRVVELQITSLLAGSEFRGDFEKLVQQLLEEAEADPDLILFIDEVHIVVGAWGSRGSAADLAQILKPALVKGTLRVVGATTPDEYRARIEKDAALERRFLPIRIEEPSEEDTRALLHGIRKTLEAHHSVILEDEALDAAVELSVRYLPDRRLPDKARDLLDQAAASRRFVTVTPGKAHSPSPLQVTRDDVAQVVAEWTGIPVDRLTKDDRKRLLQLDQDLARRVIGQDHAVSAVARVVRTAFAGLSDDNRPHGVFLFVGPTGVGKTELAKALAAFVFGHERHLLRFDMSEYHDQYTAAKLIGSPPGYIGHDEGGQLTNAIRRTPYAVVLFDEVEKAYHTVIDLFLQIFDAGRLTDGKGRVADFTNTIVIMTSNIGSSTEAMKGPVGFHHKGSEASPESDGIENDVQAALRGHFRPELLNRVSEIVQFHSLERDHVRAIIDKMVGEVQRRRGIAEQGIVLELQPGAYDILTDLGYRPEYGARELQRVIDRHIVQPLANALLEGRFARGTTVYVIPMDDGVTLSTSPDAAAPDV